MAALTVMGMRATFPCRYGADMAGDPSTSVAARVDADAAAARSGVTIRTIPDEAGVTDAMQVFDQVWPPMDGGTSVPPNLFIALVHAGGYASVAYIGGVPVGAALGVVGRHRDAQGEWHTHIHSHMAGVIEGFRDRHIGTALKLHQRAWCLAAGIGTVVWTFDPLVKRNARLNILKLGVDVRGYEVNFYGDMPDAVNAGDPSDRVFAWWELSAPRVRAAIDGLLTATEVLMQDRVIVIPDDIVELRTSQPDEARMWRERVRGEMLTALDAGYAVAGLDGMGNYVMRRVENADGH